MSGVPESLSSILSEVQIFRQSSVSVTEARARGGDVPHPGFTVMSPPGGEADLGDARGEPHLGLAWTR